MKRTTVKLALMALVGAMGCASTSLPEDELSASEHERAARADSDQAHETAERYDNRAVRYATLYPERPAQCDKSLSGSCSPYWTMTKNPTDRELSLASAYRTRAKRHREKAQALLDAEARACASVSLWDQDMSPFLHARDIDAVEEMGHSSGRGPSGTPAGAAIAFGSVPDLTAQNLQTIVDCHLARNAALGWDQSDNNECPLNVKGAEAKVRQAGENLVVEVTARDAAAALEILKRARALLPHPSLTAR